MHIKRHICSANLLSRSQTVGELTHVKVELAWIGQSDIRGEGWYSGAVRKALLSIRRRKKTSARNRTRAAGTASPSAPVPNLAWSDDTAGTGIPAKKLNFKAGQGVYHAGEPATYLYEVISGMLMVSKHLRDGRRQVVEVAPQGWVCGFSDRGEYDASCEALSPAAPSLPQRRWATEADRTLVEHTRCDRNPGGIVDEGEEQILADVAHCGFAETACAYNSPQIAA
jgi:hypothetical protein